MYKNIVATIKNSSAQRSDFLVAAAGTAVRFSTLVDADVGRLVVGVELELPLADDGFETAAAAPPPPAPPAINGPVVVLDEDPNVELVARDSDANGCATAAVVAADVLDPNVVELLVPRNADNDDDDDDDVPTCCADT